MEKSPPSSPSVYHVGGHVYVRSACDRNGALYGGNSDSFLSRWSWKLLRAGGLDSSGSPLLTKQMGANRWSPTGFITSSPLTAEGGSLTSIL